MTDTIALLGPSIALDWHTSRVELAAGGREVGLLARHTGPTPAAVLALTAEAAAVQLVRKKDKRFAWGLLAGFAVGHLLVAGCNRARCW